MQFFTHYHSILHTLQYLNQFTINAHWSVEEETLLADMWLEISRNNEGLNERSFLDRVVARFNEWIDGDQRNKNMITAKWA